MRGKCNLLDKDNGYTHGHACTHMPVHVEFAIPYMLGVLFF